MSNQPSFNSKPLKQVTRLNMDIATNYHHTELTSEGIFHKNTHSIPFTLIRVPNQNIPHVLNLNITSGIQHEGRQVLLQRTEKERAELQLKVLVTIRLVIGVRVQPEPVGGTRCNGAVSLTITVLRFCSSLYRGVHGHGVGEDSRGRDPKLGFLREEDDYGLYRCCRF